MKRESERERDERAVDALSQERYRTVQTRRDTPRISSNPQKPVVGYPGVRVAQDLGWGVGDEVEHGL